MKRFSEHINETFTPGNNLLNTGVTNHYTPVQNILTNVKNLFCLLLGVVAEVGEDGLSIKLSSTQFISQEKTNELLWRAMYNDVFTYGTSSLYGYITSQGLRKVTYVNLGGYYVVYFSPEDIVAAQKPVNMEPDAKSYVSVGDESGECCPCCCPCPKEACESLIAEFEVGMITEADNLLDKDDNKSDDKDDDKDKDDNNDNNDDNNNNDSNDNSNDDDSKLLEILSEEDKLKAAKQLEIYISSKIQLPRNYYFTVIKFNDEDNEEAIALRWKREQKLPNGKSIERTRSLIHIFGTGEGAIWVQDFAKDSIINLPKDVETLVNNILNIFKAKKTKDAAIFDLGKEKENSDDNDEVKDSNNENTDDQNNDDDKNDKNNDLL